MTIGVSCSAACTVAVPDAVSATSADASTVSVSPFDERERHDRLPRTRVEQRSSRCGARATTNCASGTRARISARRRGEIRQDPRDLVRPAARQDRDGRRRRRQSARRRETHRASADGFARSISGWPTNSTGTPACLVDRRFERKDHQHAIGDRPHRREPSGARRPDLRADVIDHRDAEALDRRRETEVESGEIDQDRARRGARRAPPRSVAGAPRAGAGASGSSR